MNDRERFLATMTYRERDRCPWGEMGFWPETLERCKRKLPQRSWSSRSSTSLTGPSSGTNPTATTPPKAWPSSSKAST